jgi:hypothetical protein
MSGNSAALRGSFEQSNLLHQRPNLRASFNQSSQQPNQTTSMQQQQDVRASFDQFRLQQQQQPQQQQNLRASFDSAVRCNQCPSVLVVNLKRDVFARRHAIQHLIWSMILLFLVHRGFSLDMQPD